MKYLAAFGGGCLGGLAVTTALALLEVRTDWIVLTASATVGAWIGLRLAREME